MDADRNVLFGVLALELAYIDSQRLTEFCAEWAKDPSRDFSEFMVARGCLTVDEVAEIERLLQRKLAQHNDDVRGVLASEATVSARLAIQDADAELLRQTMAYLPSSSDYSPIHAVSVHPDQRTRYTLTRVHGQGGLGRVWLAHDNHLNRPVALKEILPGKEALALENRRFVKEAQVTGQLEHPNIVPIYELASDASQGSSFYTMRFIRGRTLRAEIETYHQHRREGKAGPLELQKLLQAFVSICHALAFAHSRGVIHRDLKPANVMMGSFGEVIVVDWGLAKLVDQRDDEETSDSSSRSRPISITESGSVEATQAGLLLGTLPFMAPEQAAGRIDLLDRRTDIYGLGAILFSILTGNTPHHGSTTHEIQSRIVNQPTPHAKQAEASVASALDAVCAKAMAKEIAHRYATASELADDVQRWLADEPVSVFRDPWTTHVARWIRRHKSSAIAIASSLLVISTVAIVSAVVTNRARRSEQTARVAETQAKVEAANRLRDARSVLDTTLMQMSRVLVDYPDIQPFRRMLLERAAMDYQRFAAEKSDDQELQAESGNAFLRLSEVYKLLEEHAKAIAACQSAEQVFQALLTQTKDSRFALLLANSQRMRGGLLRAANELAAAEDALAAAQATLTELPREAPVQVEAARIQVEQSRIAARRGNHAQAVQGLQTVVQDLNRTWQDGEVAVIDELLASTHGQLATELAALGQAQAGVDAAQKAVDAYQRLLARSRKSSEFIEGHAVSSIQWAYAARAIGRTVDELQAYQSAISDYEELVGARPEIPQYRQNLAVARHDLAQLFQSIGRNQQAKRWANEALGELDYLLKHYPKSIAYNEEWAVACITLGRVVVALGDDKDAETQFIAATQIFQTELLPAEPKHPPHWRGLGVTYSNFGRLRHRQQRFDDAVKLFQQAIDSFDKALARQSDASADHATRNALAWSKTYLGETLWKKGDQAGAAAAFTEARAIRETLPKLPEYLANFARLLIDCDDETQRDLPRAAQLAGDASHQSPENGQYLYIKALAQYRAGKWSECAAILTDAKKLRLSPNGFDGLLEAMVQWQLQHPDDARRILADTLATTFAAEHVGSIEFQELVHEAKTLIGP